MAKERKAWRELDSPLAKIDIIGVGHFIYGGNAEWVRRRWFMLFWLLIGWLSCFLACLANLLFGFSEALTQTILTSNFALNGGVVLGYLGFAEWGKKNELISGATVTETSTIVTDEGPPASTTEVTTTETAPAEGKP